MVDYTTGNAVRIVEACLQAGKPQLIVPALIARRSAESVIDELAAATPAPAPAASHPPARSGGGPTADELEAAAQARFKVTNARAPDRVAEALERRLRTQSGPR